MAFRQNDDQYAMLHIGRQRKCRGYLEEMKTISLYGIAAAENRGDDVRENEWSEFRRMLAKVDALLCVMEEKYDADELRRRQGAEDNPAP